MTLIFIILAAAFTAAMLYNLPQPFLRGREDSIRFELLDDDLRQIGELAAQKADVLKALREVQFDHDTGKLTDEDYKTLKTRYERRALKIMRALDEIHGGRGWEDAIDEQLEERLQALQRENEMAEKAALTSAILAQDADQAARRCAECDHKLDAEARFCSRCGATQKPAEDANNTQDAEDGADQLAAQPLATSGPKVTT